MVQLAEGRERQTYEPGTAEAAMQAYLAAWDNDDPNAAYDFFSNSIKASVSREDYSPVATPSAISGRRTVRLHRPRGWR